MCVCVCVCDISTETERQRNNHTGRTICSKLKCMAHQLQ